MLDVVKRFLGDPGGGKRTQALLKFLVLHICSYIVFLYFWKHEMSIFFDL